jgi:hypothetical protein
MADEVSAGKITVGFEADLSGLQQGFAEARKSLDTLGKQMAQGGSGMNDLAKAGHVAAGVLGAEFVMGALNAAKAVVGFASSVTESSSRAVEALETVAEQTGLTIQQLQQMQPVFARNNLSIEAMGGIFRVLARNIQQARDPTSQASKAFKELGISLTGMEKPSEVFTLIAERMSQLPKGFEKTRLQTELLGRSGTRLSGVFKEGAAGLRASADEARNMGNILNDEANEALLKVNDSFDNLETATSNLEKHLGVLFAPMIQAANEARLALINLAVQGIDAVIVASRTLWARWQGIWGFLSEVASLSILEWGKIPDIFAKWDEQTTKVVAGIRQTGVVALEVKDSMGKVNKAAVAAGAAMAAEADRVSLALVQLDMGWKIVEKAALAWRVAQKQAMDDTVTNEKQVNDLSAAMRDVATATDTAAVAMGAFSRADLAQNNWARSIQALQSQMNLVATTAENSAAALKLEADAAATTAERKLAIINEVKNISSAALNQIAVLQAQADAANIAGASAVQQARQQIATSDLNAMAQQANAEVRILEARYADADDLRAARLNAINAQMNAELSVVGQTEQQKLAIYRNAEAEKMNLARQYPTFMQKQMQDLVASNVFSLSQITTSFTNATAQWIVTGQNFQAFWQQLQITIVQAFLNGLIQMAVNYALRLSMMEGLTGAFEIARTAIFGTGETARLGIAAATNKLIAVSMIASLGSMMALGTGAVAIMSSVMLMASAMMAAIAAALVAGIVTAPLAGPVSAAAGMLAASAGTLSAAGFGAIQAAGGAAIVAASAFGGFAKGGIVRGPTFGLMGEAGSPEAAIPLNDQGAKFMAKTLGIAGGGGGRGTSQTIILQLDREVLLRTVLTGLPRFARLHAGGA